jgi:hypothetical protein
MGRRPRAFAAMIVGAALIGLSAARCSDDPAKPGMSPTYCTSSLSPKAETICNGASLILTLSGGPSAGEEIVWTSDVGSLAHANDQAVFEAPSSGSGTARIRVRWSGTCDLTSYIAYEPCDGGTAGADASTDASTDADAWLDARNDSAGAGVDGDAGSDDACDDSSDGAGADADAGPNGPEDAGVDAPDAG